MEIKGNVFQVSYVVPTSWGLEHEDVKFFTTEEEAREYAKKLLEELKKRANETEEESVEIRLNGRIRETWIMEQGKIQRY